MIHEAIADAIIGGSATVTKKADTYTVSLSMSSSDFAPIENILQEVKNSQEQDIQNTTEINNKKQQMVDNASTVLNL